MNQTYTFKVAPTYTAACYATKNDLVTLDEWAGRTVEEFAAGMKGRGFKYRTETYELSSGTFTEHVWEK